MILITDGDDGSGGMVNIGDFSFNKEDELKPSSNPPPSRSTTITSAEINVAGSKSVAIEEAGEMPEVDLSTDESGNVVDDGDSDSDSGDDDDV
mmetsp:Transcript_27213/g.50166  ORF Transcript_27213/g.50166 Transcript_27213/m.50166 type:complete len:93 (-) Transcript_27213:411-689(-)|eukprot:CAMPEP_0175057016 /NCGR_PEP_ID=MMETSP0052_2-20121109/11015_1 /TAXON_ID=51329 ORGANISM="Polytomella parva, Strain SAG 63-3" /NCGR_SAMPLE_ID=MMETSP0052_2 /ASSEMBLY_ACC=CAM_ASM_000194 /LENGTH=92 /DNA_ID=CAMNT_0016322153 /DNA_START=501 /DNA_END=779 /DNA_ORIENTATION=+